ncbi:MAG: ABC transporter permease [Gracilibacteraceae bacterium]|nr:ABC transporter permease [Gracilibacteraceae bacterium]
MKGTENDNALLAKRVKARSAWAETWDRLKQQPVAMIALGGIVLIFLIAIFGDLIANYKDLAIAQNAAEKLQPPSLRHLFGTDRFGRDMFARIVHGTRIAIAMGFVSTLAAIFVSVIMSCLAAIYGNRTDNFVMRVVDVISSIPNLVMAIAICSGLGQGLWQLVVALAFGSIPYATKMCRSVALSVVQNEFIEATRALGGGTWYTIRRHLLPNIASITIVTFTGTAAFNILMGATLSFIGLGVKAPRPEWGLMLSESMSYMTRYPYLAIVPGLAIVLTALCINTFGDYLRDALDPQLKGKV